jgi:hypothetical protein
MGMPPVLSVRSCPVIVRPLEPDGSPTNEERSFE